MSDVPSNKPYLIRALHQWCTDFGFTPFIAVFVDGRVEVPMEFVKNDEIVLNLSLEACHQLQMDNDWISFQARFGGIPRKIMVPVSHVLAIYARENGQGMSFPFDPVQARALHAVDVNEYGSEQPKTPRPSLKIVK
ncbi:ClpXP protease specificity-enhancing factor [Polynucleobacter wuianus]|uniref:ClpXP protease specificity-enhancing factor n=1 Tax=Polynucleobacter wuianus TaxID=1743168 RepID=A0A191UCK4_9BURK|nr:MULTISPECIES: ClpXP protease specificity-enhancing factor [Polynucleobacter]ANI98744.1 ClpXP protease specificity-enhancing factor [Polynucleobacter wuianus]MBU3553307.1 ClpXP protease specificity-enhancing factor [Polynucleobacter sp. MWH-Post4-6-1]